MAVVLKIFTMLCVFLIEWKLIKMLDADYRNLSKEKEFLIATAYMILTAFWGQKSILQDMLSCFFWSSIALAAYCDYCTHYIPDLVYFPAIIAGVIKFMGCITVGAVIELLIFCLLQLILFRRFYGESDCIAFSVCALYISASGKGLSEHIYLMAVTYILLAVVQGVRRNINRRGNLKEPVALLPYIAAAMLLYH